MDASERGVCSPMLMHTMAFVLMPCGAVLVSCWLLPAPHGA